MPWIPLRLQIGAALFADDNYRDPLYRYTRRLYG